MIFCQYLLIFLKLQFAFYATAYLQLNQHAIRPRDCECRRGPWLPHRSNLCHWLVTQLHKTVYPSRYGPNFNVLSLKTNTCQDRYLTTAAMLNLPLVKGEKLHISQNARNAFRDREIFGLSWKECKNIHIDLDRSEPPFAFKLERVVGEALGSHWNPIVSWS